MYRTVYEAERYHERTKHSWESVHRGGRVLSWADKPDPFKRYPRAGRTALPRELPSTEVPSLDSACGAGRGPARPLDVAGLARLLRWGAGVARVRRLPGETYYFRTYPSAGALYPVEVYVACAPLDALPAGLYHFHPGELALQRLRECDVRGHLAAAGAEQELGGAGAVLCLSGIPWRTGWKYGERGYRHLFWDAGTMLANLIALAVSAGLGPRLRAGFVDRHANAILGLDGKREAVLALLAVGRAEPMAEAEDGGPAADTGPASSAIQSGGLEPIAVRARPLSRWEESYPEARDAHAAARLESPEETRAWRREAADETEEELGAVGPPGGLPSDSLEAVIHRRGSARGFVSEPITRAELEAILACATAPIPADFPTLCEAHLILHAVEDLEPGVYRVSSRRALERLRAGNFRETAAYLCLEQAHGGSGAATLFFLCDLPTALAELGERGYRAAQLEAGVRAGRVSLAAYALGLAATGLTFYDDEVAEFLTGETRKQPMMCVSLGVDSRRRDLRRVRERSGMRR
jgi:SagB-type dehydrogenase family enzyme